jgi:hypothetical protein
MHALRCPWFVFVVMLGGCPSNADVESAPSSSASTPAPAKPEPAKPEPAAGVAERPELPSMDTAPAVPAVKVVAASAECPPLPTLEPSAPDSARSLVPVLELLRGISCRPELFGKSRADVVAALSVPDGLVLEIGRRYAHVELAQPVLVSDVLAVAGVTGAKLRLEQGWAPSWVVVDAGGEHAPRPWGAAQLDIRLAAPDQDDGEHGSSSELTPDMRVQGRLGVSISAEALAFEPDSFAASSIIAALDAIAEQPELLNDASKAHAVLDSLGERYSVSLYAVGMGEAKRTGFSLRPHRTELLASELATNLPIPSARHIEVPITDANRNRLASGEDTPFIWRGLELEIELDPRDGSHVGLSAWVVNELLILPAPTQAAH